MRKLWLRIRGKSRNQETGGSSLHMSKTPEGVPTEGVENPKIPPKIYLGDAVYAEVEHGMIKLSTEGWDSKYEIYLEPEVYAALVEYAKRVWP